MYSMIEIKNENHWHEIRKTGLGGSDIGTILGYNKYKTDYELWQEKTGRVQAKDLSDNKAIIRGKEAEEHLRGLFRANNPDLIVSEPSGFTYRSNERKYALANTDGQVNNDTVLEIKTAKVRSMEEWQDQIPMMYYCQVMWYMYVKGFKKAILYAMIEKINFDETKENDFYLKTYHINYNEEEMQEILKKTDEFWEKVQKNEWKEFKIKLGGL